MGSSWAAPPSQDYGDIRWQISVMLISLCIPFWLVSIWSETFIARCFTLDKSKAYRWSFIANSLSYGLIIICFVGFLIYVIWSHKQEEFGYIGRTGNLISVPANACKLGDFSEGLAPVLMGKKWCYLDTSGKCVIPPQFDEAAAFSDGMAHVWLAEHKEQGFINKSGELVIKLQRKDSFGSFSQGLSSIRTAEGEIGFIK